MKKRFAVTALAMLALGQAQWTYAQQSSGTQKGLASLFSSSSEDELIEPDLAFKLKATAKGADTIVAELAPAKGYYLYKEKIRFTLKGADGTAINAVKLPAGEMKTDQVFGRTEVYKKPVAAEITLKRAPKANKVTLVASYQGCHEKLGVCYPPIEKAIEVTLK